MASPLALTAISSIVNGTVFAPNFNLLQAITDYQNLPTVQQVGNIFSLAAAQGGGTIAKTLLTELTNLGSGVGRGQFLIDFYPRSGNITQPLTNGSITYYGTMPIPVNTISESGAVQQTGWANTAITSTASFGNTILTQAQLPFNSGIGSFANVVSSAATWANKHFDTISSVSILKTKTHATLGSSGVTDMATGGVGTSGTLIAGIVSKWGTMYDIKNMNLIGDPYVFGQNLLNQGLGNYGGLSTQLILLGLDINDITAVPPATNSTLNINSTVNVTYPTIGDVTYAGINKTPVSTASLAQNANAVVAVYQTITSVALTSIITGTGATVTTIDPTTNNLADFLTLGKIVDDTTLADLNALGIYDINSLGAFLHNIIGNGVFPTWADVASFLLAVETPQQHGADTNLSSPVVNPAAMATLVDPVIHSGSGPFGNPTLVDYIGLAAGMPNYTTDFKTIASNASQFDAPVIKSLGDLYTAANNYVNAYQSFLSSTNAPGFTFTPPSINPVTLAVASVNRSLNFLNTSNPAFQSAQTAYNDIMHSVFAEVTNNIKANVGFTSTPYIQEFAQQIISSLNDPTGFYDPQLLANIIVNNVAGDPIRAAIAESNNAQTFAKVGLTLNNDPNPYGVAAAAAYHGVSISTVLAQTYGAPGARSST